MLSHSLTAHLLAKTVTAAVQYLTLIMGIICAFPSLRILRGTGRFDWVCVIQSLRDGTFPDVFGLTKVPRVPSSESFDQSNKWLLFRMHTVCAVRRLIDFSFYARAVCYGRKR